MCNQEKLIALYCSVDDFWKAFKLEWEKHLLGNGRSNRGPEPKLTIPEMMTLIILFHQSQYRCFKAFYCNYVSQHLYKEFSLIS